MTIPLSIMFALGQAVTVFDGWGDSLGMGLVTGPPGPYSLLVLMINGSEVTVSTSGVRAL